MTRRSNYDLSMIDDELKVTKRARGFWGLVNFLLRSYFFIAGHLCSFIMKVVTKRRSFNSPRFIGTFETRQVKISAGEDQWCMRLCDSWREIGLDQETVTERIDALSKHLDKFWEGLIDEEEEYITAVRERVEKVCETRDRHCPRVGPSFFGE